MARATVGILSLGCPRNLVDSEHILGRLVARGHRVVDITRAEVAIINTCAFIEDAKRESIDAILEVIDLKKEGKLKKVLVCGCLPQRYKDVLRKELPEIDGFVGRVSLDGACARFALTPRHYAYLKICEGCINNCSFCIIPKIKGRFISLPMGSILGQAAQYDRQRLSELNIIGQDLSGYGWDLYGKFQLGTLLKKIVTKTSHIRWLRLLYLYPSRLSDEVLAIVRDEPRICKYIDVPIQHINSRILRRMNRHTSRTEILRLLERVRRLIPQAALRTSIIVGFPSETDREFKELLLFIQEARFERLGVFIYSREEGTKAFDFRGQVPLKVKQERFSAIMLAQQAVSREASRKFLDTDIQVLIEEKEGSRYLGRSQYDAPEVDGTVYVTSRQALKIGDFARVRITDTLEYDLVGECVEPLGL